MTRLERLKVLRDRMTERIEDGVSDALLSQMVPVLAKLLAEIDVIEKDQPQRKGTVLDELAARREAEGSARTARGK